MVFELVQLHEPVVSFVRWLVNIKLKHLLAQEAYTIAVYIWHCFEENYLYKKYSIFVKNVTQTVHILIFVKHFFRDKKLKTLEARKN